MPLFGTRGAASVTGFGGLAKLGYLLRNSLRFRASNSATLSRTPSVDGNRKMWTWSAWVKRGALDSGAADRVLFASPSQSGNDGIAAIYFDSDQLHTYYDTSGANPYGPIGPRLYRDPAAWMHIVWAVDAANTIHYVYVDNTLVSTDAAYYPPNYDYSMNRSGYTHYFGTQAWGPTDYFDGYMAEVNFVDGQALTPSSFGKTDAATGQWVPKQYSGTYGTNGFYLKFTDASAATAAAIGKDFSGNGNNWTPSGISVTAGATYDSMTDVPTLTSATAANYATINPLDYNSTYLTLNDGNLHQTYAGVVAAAASRATMVIPTTGKYYWEVYINATGGGSGERIRVGITSPTVAISGNSLNGDATSYLQMSNGQKRTGTTDSTYGAGFSATQYIQVLYDATAGAIYFGQNNNFANGTGSFNQTFSTATAAFTGLSGEFMPCFVTYGGADIAVNFGQQPFAYTPPSGFKNLNTFNLP